MRRPVADTDANDSDANRYGYLDGNPDQHIHGRGFCLLRAIVGNREASDFLPGVTW